MKNWIFGTLIAALAAAAGCRAAQPTSPAASRHGRWQVTSFVPSEDLDVEGAILLDSLTGDSYVLCEDATSWCKLDRPE